MFYLTMRLTHFIYACMVKNHIDGEMKNPLPLPSGQQGIFYMYHPKDWIVYIVRTYVEHWLE